MRITAFSQTTDSAQLLEDIAAQRQMRTDLLALGRSTGLEFSVVRDTETQRFVVRVIQPGTGNIVGQFPAESILRQLPEGK